MNNNYLHIFILLKKFQAYYLFILKPAKYLTSRTSNVMINNC